MGGKISYVDSDKISVQNSTLNSLYCELYKNDKWMDLDDKQYTVQNLKFYPILSLLCTSEYNEF